MKHFGTKKLKHFETNKILKMFISKTKDGLVFQGYPIGDHKSFDGIELKNADEVFLQVPKIFIIFTHRTHEKNIVSVKNQAGFTLRASNKKKGITYGDIAMQIKRIVKLMRNNPDVFDMVKLDDAKDDSLILYKLDLRITGYYEVDIAAHTAAEKIDFQRLNDIFLKKIIYDNKGVECPFSFEHGEDD